MAQDTLTSLATTPTYTVPADVYEIVVEIWAQSGSTYSYTTGAEDGPHTSPGAGGGAYSKKTFSTTPSATFSYQNRPTTPADGSGALNAWFKANDSTGCVAEGGASNYYSTGGRASQGQGDVKYSGGTGGVAGGTKGGGGGGGAGASGNGGNGVAGDTSTGGAAGSGDGTNSAGTAGVGTSSSSAPSNYSGAPGGAYAEGAGGTGITGTAGTQSVIKVTYYPRQSVTLPTIASGATFYGPTVTSGAQSLSAPTLASGATLYGPTLTPGAVSLTLPTLASGETLYGPTVSPGAVTLSAPALASTVAFYNPSVSTPGLLTLPTIASGETLFAPAVAPGAVYTSAPFIPSVVFLYPPTLTPGATTVTLPLAFGGATLYPATIVGDQTITLPTMASTAVLYPPGFPQLLGAPTVTSTAAFYAATVYATPAFVDLLVEIARVNRTSEVLATPIKYTRGIEQIGGAAFSMTHTIQSYPRRMDQVTIWTDYQTAVGSMTQGSNRLFVPMAFTGAYVGAHVRVRRAGPYGADLGAQITAVIDLGEVELDASASYTVEAADVLVGDCWFTGTVLNAKRTAIGDEHATQLHVEVSCQDLAGAAQDIFPRGDYAAGTLRSRLESLLDDGDIAAHGLRLHWSNYTDPLDLYNTGDRLGLNAGGYFELYANRSGRQVLAASYTGGSSLLDIIRALMSEEGLQRNAWFDALGRLRVDPYGKVAFPSALTAANLRMVGAGTETAQSDFVCRVLYYWGGNATPVVVEDLASVTASAIDNALELYSGDFLALNGGGRLDLYDRAQYGRVVERVVTDVECPDEETARERATALLDTLTSLGLYLFRGVTDTVGYEPGQVGTATLSKFNISGDHLIQTVSAVYRSDYAEPMWEFELQLTNNIRPVETPLEYWRRNL